MDRSVASRNISGYPCQPSRPAGDSPRDSAVSCRRDPRVRSRSWWHQNKSPRGAELSVAGWPAWPWGLPSLGAGSSGGDRVPCRLRRARVGSYCDTPGGRRPARPYVLIRGRGSDSRVLATQVHRTDSAAALSRGLEAPRDRKSPGGRECLCRSVHRVGEDDRATYLLCDIVRNSQDHALESTCQES